MQVIQTAAEPPNHGRIILAIIGCIWKNRNALRKMVTEYARTPLTGIITGLQRAANKPRATQSPYTTTILHHNKNLLNPPQPEQLGRDNKHHNSILTLFQSFNLILMKSSTVNSAPSRIFLKVFGLMISPE